MNLGQEGQGVWHFDTGHASRLLLWKWLPTVEIQALGDEMDCGGQNAFVIKGQEVNPVGGSNSHSKPGQSHSDLNLLALSIVAELLFLAQGSTSDFCAQRAEANPFLK